MVTQINLAQVKGMEGDFKVHRDLVVQDDATIKDDLWVEGASTIYSGPYKAPVCRIKTGTYTGDGSLGQAITGVGFQPKFIWIWPHVNSEATHTTWNKLDQSWGDYAAYHQDVGGHYTLDNRINSLDADGFTVDDDGLDKDPNKLNQVYDYLAIG